MAPEQSLPNSPIQSDERRFPNGTLLVVTLVGMFVSVLVFLMWPVAFWAGYLIAAMFWSGVSLGILGIALLHRTTGGRWGYAIGHELHAGLSTLLVGFAAIWLLGLGCQHIYAWGHWQTPTSPIYSQLNEQQQSYLRPEFIALRLLVFQGLWILMARWLQSAYRHQAEHPPEAPSRFNASINLLLFFVTVSFFVWDAMLSLTPDWVSSIFPLQQILGFAVSGMAVSIILSSWSALDVTEEGKQLTHDEGNLLQALNLLWAYLAFSQYLIIWSGDSPHEVQWFVDRQSTFGNATALTLIGLHFLVPFFLLLSRERKRSAVRLARVAALLLCMRLVDLAWTILPSTPASTAQANAAALVSTVTLGAIWLLLYRWNAAKVPFVPIVAIPAEHGSRTTQREAAS